MTCTDLASGVRSAASFATPLLPPVNPVVPILLGQRTSTRGRKPRADLHALFPLRQFLCCPTCGNYARGYTVTKKNGTAFHYYDCKNGDCHFRIHRDDAHEQFVAKLRKLTASLQSSKEDQSTKAQRQERRKYEEVVKQEQMTQLSKKLQEHEALSSFAKYTSDPEKRRIAELGLKQLETEIRAAKAALDSDPAEDRETQLRRFIREYGDLAEAWMRGDLEMKIRIQVLQFSMDNLV
jgi:hypothetical protein